MVVPMPADTIADNIISAGWLLSQMDLAGGRRACRYVRGRAVTVGVDKMEFTAPVYIGDTVTIYTEIMRQGKSSVAIKIEAYALAGESQRSRKVTDGIFTFVHIDEKGRAKAIEPPAPGHAAPAAGKRFPKASATEQREEEPSPSGGRELSLRVVPLPRHKNHNGDIFGGWVLSQMDLAGAVRARRHTGCAAVPVAIEAMTFHRPVSELSEVSFYTQIERVGRTSVTIKVEAWALRKDLTKYEKVTEGSFVYVAIDAERRPVPIKSGP